MAETLIKKVSLDSGSTDTFGTWIDKTNQIIDYRNTFRTGQFNKGVGSITVTTGTEGTPSVIASMIVVTGKAQANGLNLYEDGSEVVKEALMPLDEFNAHVSNTDNPHRVTLEQIGLSNFQRVYGGCYSDAGRIISDDEQDALDAILNDKFGLIVSDTLDSNTDREHLVTSKAIYDYVQSQYSIIVDELYPVGSVYMNYSNPKNPSELLGVGTWVNVGVGRVVMSTSSSAANYNSAGTTGGATTVKLDDVRYLPAHDHKGTTTSAGGHNHNRGEWNIIGSFSSPDLGRKDSKQDRRNGNSMWSSDGPYSGKDHHSGNGVRITVASPSNWGATDERGGHGHDVGTNTSAYTPSANIQSFSIMQPYLVVYIWRRTS